MKTAVEWLSEHLCNEMNFDYWKAVEQAKEMEKEQMINLFKAGHLYSGCPFGLEQYYNETFKNTDK
jgi:hypothetical protein